MFEGTEESVQVTPLSLPGRDEGRRNFQKYKGRSISLYRIQTPYSPTISSCTVTGYLLKDRAEHN
jgi:hypothetical protein